MQAFHPLAPHHFHKYDNLGRRLASATYSSVAGISAASDDPTTKTTNRLALAETHFDEQGRVYKSVARKVDATDGTLQDSLESLHWFDSEGLEIKSDGSQLTKTIYDRLGRVTHEFVLAKTNDTAYAHAADVAGDIVLEERQTTYDPADGHVLMRATIRRLHTDRGLGQTTGPRASSLALEPPRLDHSPTQAPCAAFGRQLGLPIRQHGIDSDAGGWLVSRPTVSLDTP